MKLSHEELSALLEAAGRPAIIFSEDKNLSLCNQEYVEWLSGSLGLEPETIDLDQMRVNFRRPYQALLENAKAHQGTAKNVPVSVMLPGYALSVYADMTQRAGSGDADPSFMVCF